MFHVGYFFSLFLIVGINQLCIRHCPQIFWHEYRWNSWLYISNVCLLLIIEVPKICVSRRWGRRRSVSSSHTYSWGGTRYIWNFLSLLLMEDLEQLLIRQRRRSWAFRFTYKRDNWLSVQRLLLKRETLVHSISWRIGALRESKATLLPYDESFTQYFVTKVYNFLGWAFWGFSLHFIYYIIWCKEQKHNSYKSHYSPLLSIALLRWCMRSLNK